MKKLFLFASAAFITQTAFAQLSVAPELGFQMTNVPTKSDGEKVKANLKAGFRIGANLDLTILEQLHLQGGIFYSDKGGKTTNETLGSGTVVLESTATLNYLEIPFYLNYMTGEAGGNRFFIGAGPYIGYCLGGKTKYKNPITGQDESVTLKVGTDKTNDNIKPLDMGININVGYMLSNNFYARAQYGIGLTNNMPSGNKDNSEKNAGFAISIGYNFGL
jgi:hypothetical protein